MGDFEEGGGGGGAVLEGAVVRVVLGVVSGVVVVKFCVWFELSRAVGCVWGIVGC